MVLSLDALTFAEGTIRGLSFAVWNDGAHLFGNIGLGLNPHSFWL